MKPRYEIRDENGILVFQPTSVVAVDLTIGAAGRWESYKTAEGTFSKFVFGCDYKLETNFGNFFIWKNFILVDRGTEYAN